MKTRSQTRSQDPTPTPIPTTTPTTTNDLETQHLFSNIQNYIDLFKSHNLPQLNNKMVQTLNDTLNKTINKENIVSCKEHKFKSQKHAIKYNIKIEKYAIVNVTNLAISYSYKVLVISEEDSSSGFGAYYDVRLYNITEAKYNELIQLKHINNDESLQRLDEICK